MQFSISIIYDDPFERGPATIYVHEMNGLEKYITTP